MSTGFLGISRCNTDEDDEYRAYGGSNISPWMSSFIQQMVLNNSNQQSQAQQVQQRQSIIGDVNNILTNPQRYASVEDAVMDMRERTGLNSYLQKINSSKKEQLKAITADINAYANSSLYNVPDCLSKYGIDEEIIYFLKNTCNDSKGLSVTIPQLQDDLLHVFGGKYKLQPQDVWNDDTASFIDGFIVEARSTNREEPFNINIGLGLGNNDNDTSKEDHFSILDPNRR
jgi:hypothetical protein